VDRWIGGLLEQLRFNLLGNLAAIDRCVWALQLEESDNPDTPSPPRGPIRFPHIFPFSQTCSSIRRLDWQSVSRSIPPTMRMMMHQFTFPAFAELRQQQLATCCSQFRLRMGDLIGRRLSDSMIQPLTGKNPMHFWSIRLAGFLNILYFTSQYLIQC